MDEDETLNEENVDACIPRVELPDGKENLEEKIHQLEIELNEYRSLVTVAECQKENAIETERKCQEEVASLQRIMEEAVSDATSQLEKEVAHLQKANEKLKSELTEFKSQVKERPDFSKEGVIAAVAKSLKRVGNLSSPLPFGNSGEGIESLEDSMKKAQEDSEVLTSLIVPLDEEIKALKDKLRSTDEQLRVYETAFSDLVKSLGSDSLSEMIKGKGPAKVVEHLDEKIISLSKGLKAEKSSRNDLEMFVAVLTKQKTVMQDEMDWIKKELQEVCHLLEREKKEHCSLKRTWQMANDQFLEAQRLQTMDMLRIQSVLTSEQQRQISELKKRDEERMELEMQKQREKQDAESDRLNGGKTNLSTLSRPSSAKLFKSSPITHRRIHSNQSRLSDELDLLSPTSARAQSIPANLNQAVEDALSEKRSLSSSALNKVVIKEDKASSFSSTQTSTLKEDAVFSPEHSPSTKDEGLQSSTSPILTKDQLKALSDITPEQEVRKALVDNARAETEGFSLVGKRLVSEKEWQLLEEELRKAREKFGQPCEMCSNYELQLQHVQRQEQEQRQKAITMEQTLEGYKQDLVREMEYRRDLEEKFSELAKQCEKQISDIFKKYEEAEKELLVRKSEFELFQKKVREYQEIVHSEKQRLKLELARIRHENDSLLGKHIAKSQEMQSKDIDLPNSVEELQFKLLQRQEELITAVAAKEDVEENLRSEIQILRHQLISEQTSREGLEKTFNQEMDGLRQQLAILESQNQALETTGDHLEADIKITSLQDDVEKKNEIILELQNQIAELESSRVKLDGEVREQKSKVQSLQTDLDNSEAVQKDFVKLSQSLQVELEKIRQSDNEVRWQHDEDVPECNTCKKNFQHRREKSHCNHCGKIFCCDCTSKSVCSGPNQRLFRVCNVCHTLLDRQTAPYFSSEPPQSQT